MRSSGFRLEFSEQSLTVRFFLFQGMVSAMSKKVSALRCCISLLAPPLVLH